MATLVKQHSRYSLQFYDPARTPMRKRVALLTSQKRTADALQRKLEHDYALGRFDPWHDDPFTYDRPRDPPGAPMSLQSAVDGFLTYQRQHDRQPTTLRTYSTLLNSCAKSVGPETPLAEVAPEHVRAYVWADDVASATRYTRYRHIKAFFAYLARSASLPDLARSIEAPPNRDRLPRIVTETDLDALCLAVEKDYDAKLKKGHCREGEIVWLVPLLRFAFLSGLRASELGRLRWSHVDLSTGTLTILKQKSGKEQIVPLSRRAVDVLRGVAREDDSPDAFVFAAPGHATAERSVQSFVWGVSAAFRRARTAAKITRPICFHGLRHGFCTYLATAGVSAPLIQRAARHANVATTMRYVSLSDDALRQSLDDAFGQG